MPHAVIGGKIDISMWSETFTELIEETDGWKIKFDKIFVERRGYEALLSVVVVEEGHSQNFYIRMSQHNQNNKRTTVRLDPLTDPIKTRGVKRSLALLAETLTRNHSKTQVERHNLQGFLNTN